MTRRILTMFVLLLSALGCGREEISRDQWLRMSSEERRLVVESLKGGETARERKGGGSQSYPRPSEEYRDEIDARYRSGEERSVNEIWRELAEDRR